MCEPIHYLPIRVGGRKEKGAIFVLLHRKRQSETPICHHVLHIFFFFSFFQLLAQNRSSLYSSSSSTHQCMAI